MKQKLTASMVAGFLNSVLCGEDIEILNVSPVSEATPGSLVFANDSKYLDSLSIKCTVIIPAGFFPKDEVSYSFIHHENPRLAFALVTARYFSTPLKTGISSTVSLGQDVRIGKDVVIGEFCVIGDGVVIGDRTIINHNVIIHAGCTVGSDCYLKSGTVIGEDGFGFERNSEGVPIRIPHLGKVVIGNNVEIGSKCTIPRGTIGDTVIGNHVKIDDQVHFAHNVKAAARTIITACAELSGGVEIGEDCWIGPNVSVMQKVKIGKGSLIGLGAVVLKDVDSGATMVGNPAKKLER